MYRQSSHGINQLTVKNNIYDCCMTHFIWFSRLDCQPARYLSHFAICGANAFSLSLVFNSGRPRYVWGNPSLRHPNTDTQSSTASSVICMGLQCSYCSWSAARLHWQTDQVAISVFGRLPVLLCLQNFTKFGCHLVEFCLFLVVMSRQTRSSRPSILARPTSRLRRTRVGRGFFVGAAQSG